jgi:hypothetical protein
MLRSKTVWAGVSGICAALAGYFTGELEVGAALQLVVTSVLAIFLRHGISKVENGD